MKSIKRILSATLMLVMVFTMLVGTMSVSAASAVICTSSTIVVDDDFAGLAGGTTATATVGGVKYTGVIGKTAFAKLTDAVKAADILAEVYVAAGVYSGDIALEKGIKLYGNNANVSPNKEDISQKSDDRDSTGKDETILQDTVISYVPLGVGEVLNYVCSVTVNGFAFAGDSAIYLKGERLNGSEIYVGYNVFDLVNETAYKRIDASDEIFYAVNLGLPNQYTYKVPTGTFENNRVIKVTSAGNGVKFTGGMYMSWIENFYFLNNYVGNVTSDLLAFSQPTYLVNVIGNYFQSGEKVRVYDGIRGTMDISENTFDSVGGANAGGQYALGVYTDATSNNYNNTWYDTTNAVLLHDNTFINVGKAIRLYARQRYSDNFHNFGPIGTEIYNNAYTPVNPADCCFLSFGYSDGSYAPKVYDNYTGGLNPKDITVLDNCDSTADVDYGSYWLDKDMTDSSDLLAVKRITNENGVSFANAKINQAPDCSISAVVPETVTEIKIALEVGDGAYYELFADAACTVPLVNDTVTGLTTGSNYAYAKVHYLDYSLVYTILLAQKKFYTTYLNAKESVVSPEFAQYPTGQLIYVEIGGNWYRAVVGHSAFAELGVAIANASIGDTVYVTAGVYNSGMTFSKGVVIKGAQAGINPNDMSSGELKEERSNLSQETVFTKELTLAKGCNGFTMDGCTLIEQAYFYRPSAFKISDMELKNIVFKGTNADSSFRSTGNAAGNGSLNNFYFRNCYFAKGGGSYIMRWSNPSNAGIEGCVFDSCNKQIYIWGTDGGSTAVVRICNNVFKGCTAGTIIGGISDGTAKFNTSLLIEGNTLIDCSGGTFFAVNRLNSGCNITIRNNKFIGSTASGITVNPLTDTSGHTITMDHNVFGSGVKTALSNNTDCVANAAYNYFARGVKANPVSGNAVLVPYYIDEGLTMLSGSFDVESVVAPLGAELDTDRKVITYTAETAADTLAVDLKVSAGASYAIYKDAKATELLADGIIPLNGANTTAYAKVVSEDGMTSNLYTIIINQPIGNKAELLGIDVAGAKDFGLKSGVRQFVLPGSYVSGPIIPKVSAGASVSVYNGTDTEMTAPINYNEDIDIPVGITNYIAKVTSESGKTTNVFRFSVQRQKSQACELIAITGGDTPSEIVGNTATVAYSYDTTAVTPVLQISQGAEYELFTDVGGNIRLTEDLPLSIGENVCYARVTAEDGTTSTYYKLVLQRNDKSDAKYILKDTYEQFRSVLDEDDSENPVEYLGTRTISNSSYNTDYSLPYIYLTPYEFMESVDTDVKVSFGATFDIYKNYDKSTGIATGLVSNKNDPKKLTLKEGKNDFFIRVTAENNTTQFYLLRVFNLVKSFENSLITVNDFAVQRKAEFEYAASVSADRPQIDIFVSPNATVKVFADRKHTKLVGSSMKTYVITATGEEFNDCLLNESPAQSYVKYYLEITSQAGTKQNYILTLTTGSHSKEFDDVSPKFWAYKYISDAYIMGITSGAEQPDGTLKFNPNACATREEVSIFICNLLGVDATAYKNAALPYKDAKNISSWAKNAVKAVTDLGYMNGSNGNFNPKANISRQEFMTVMVRACAMDTSKGKASALKAFKDGSKVASWAKNFVTTAIYYKLVNGNNGYLYPNNSITRAEIVKIMVCAKDFAR